MILRVFRFYFGKLKYEFSESLIWTEMFILEFLINKIYIINV